jgi:hypothetical protein
MATSLEDRKTFWRGRDITPEGLIHIESDGTARSYTEEEFEQWCLDADDPEEVTYRESIPEETKIALTNRIPEYPKLDEQVECIYKAFKYLKDNGTDLGPDGNAYVEAIDAVKAKYPKAE